MRIFLVFFIAFFSSTSFALTQLFPEKKDSLNVFEVSYISDDYGPRISWNIPNETYLYKKKISLHDANGKKISINLPAGNQHNDDFFGDVEIYRISLDVPITDTGYASPIQISYQGCSDKGICYMPETESIAIDYLADYGKVPANEESYLDDGSSNSKIRSDFSKVLNRSLAAATSFELGYPKEVLVKSREELSEDQSIAKKLEGKGILISIFAFFAMGFLLAFTPCMLPILPIMVSVVGGSKGEISHRLKLGLGFVISMSLVYSAMGVIAAKLGASMVATLQEPWLIISFSMIFVVLSMAQFGLFALQLPLFIRERLQGVDQGLKGGSLIGAMSLGAISALLIGPCMTAPLAGALIYIAQSGDIPTGAIALFSLGMGSGLPLVAALTVGMRWLPKPGGWMQIVNVVFGFLLLATAIFISKSAISPSLFVALCGLWLIAVAAKLSMIDMESPRFIVRYAAIVIGIWGGSMMIGSTSGSEDPLKPLSGISSTSALDKPSLSKKTFDSIGALEKELSIAASTNTPVMLDFYAQWCTSCKSMERNIFSKSSVIDSLSDILVVKLDVTEGTDEHREFMKRFDVMGPPTFMFIGGNGREERASRISGAVSKDKFLNTVNELRIHL